MMPEMDGFEFIARVRAEPRWQRIPVIVVTAKTLTAEDLAQLNGHVQHLVHKGEYSGSPCWRRSTTWYPGTRGAQVRIGHEHH